MLTALSITGMVVLAETAGVGLAPWWMEAGLAVLAVGAGALYLRHANRIEKPILNLTLLKVATYRASLLGGSLVRLGLGATPFLMPLLLQVGLGWSPAKAGWVTIATAGGAMLCKPASAPTLRRFGFRTVLLASLIGTALFTALPAGFGGWTPAWAMALALLIGGFVRSMQFTSSNTIAYADVDKGQVSQASTLATVTQQIGMSFGVSFGALLLSLTRGAGGALTTDRFVLPFLAIGAVTLLAAPVYWRLKPDVGAEITGR